MLNQVKRQALYAGEVTVWVVSFAVFDILLDSCCNFFGRAFC